MASQKETMQARSDHPKSGDLTYRPSFLIQDNVEKSIEVTNKRDENLVDDIDLERITTAWIHKIQHFVATVEGRTDKKRQHRYQPKFFEK